MCAVFLFDNIFLLKGGKAYSNTFPYAFFKQYLSHFSQITVIARGEEVDAVGEMTLSEGDGVSFIFLESVASLKSFMGLRKKHSQTIEELIERHDVVIVRVPSEFGLMGASAAHKLEKPCIVEVVGSAWDVMWYYGGWKAKLYAPFFFRRVKQCIARAPFVSYVTQAFLQEKYPPSSALETATISDVRLPEMGEEIWMQRSKRLGEEHKVYRFGTVANLDVGYKGLDISMRVLQELADEGYQFEYHILGEGNPARHRLLAKELGIESMIFFDGVLPHNEKLWQWYDALDIYLQPSLAEGLPRSVIEAMNRGCPVAASTAGGIPELLDAEVLFSPWDRQRFKEIVTRFLKNRQVMKQQSEQNFETAKEYRYALLHGKRQKFWERFVSFAKKAKNQDIYLCGNKYFLSRR